MSPVFFRKGTFMANFSKCATGGLTAAEERVLRLIARCKTNREIASDLGISPATVKRHVENILKKLRLRSRIEAAIYSLTLDGCPALGRRRCPLELWRQKLENGGSNWAS